MPADSKTAHHVLSGKIWTLCSDDGKLIEDIDTDQIYHNAFLHITDISQMGQHALGNLEGYKDFSKSAKAGDILMAGRNFGAGSSRQQAVDCFKALKISLIIAPSFGAIYWRNAINSGFPILACSNLEDRVAKGDLETGHIIQMDLRSGKAMNVTKKIHFQTEPMNPVQYAIYDAGGLFQYGKTLIR